MLPHFAFSSTVMYGSGTVLWVQHLSTHLIHQHFYEVGTIFPILQMKKLRTREFRHLTLQFYT